jgi:chitodextrinase
MPIALILLLVCLGTLYQSIGISAAPAPVSGMVGYWNFDESSGTSVFDNSGGNNTGTISGSGLTRVAGRVGTGALSFAGGNGKVTIPHTASLNLTSSFTLAAWLRPATLSSRQTALYKGSAGACSYWIQTVGNDPSSGMGLSSTCSSYREHIATTVNAQINTWYHVTAVFNNAANTFKIYVNGTQVYTATETRTPAATSEALIFGQSPYAGGNFERWNGHLDEVRIYNRALSVQEVADVYNDQGNQDIQAPSVPTNVSATPVSSTQINLSWTASTDTGSGVAGYRVYRNGTLIGETASGNYSNSGLQPQTTYSYRVSAYDQAGNESNQSTAVSATTPPPAGDGAPPTASITAPANNAVVKGSTVSVTASASDNVGVLGVQFLLDGANLGSEDSSPPYSMVWNTTAAADGAHQLRARARDAAGNVGLSNAITVSVDNVVPTGTISINNGAAYTQSRTTTLHLSVSDGGSSPTSMRFSNTGSSYSAAEPYATTRTWTLTTGNGVKTVYAQFRDSGNWSQGFTDTITYDSAAPAISNVNASGITATAVTINWGTSEPATSRVEYGLTTSYGQTTELDSQLLGSHSMSLGDLSAGTLYNYRVRSIDAAGNEAVGANNTFTTLQGPDTTPPAVSMTLPADAATVSGAVTVAATANDNGGIGGVQFYLDGDPYGAEDTSSPFQTSWNTAQSSNGNHTLWALARDMAGNATNSATITVTVANDLEAPSVPGNVNATAGSGFRIDLSWDASTDNVGVSSYRIYRDGSFLNSTSSTTFSDIGLTPLTTYSYTISAVDAAGNTSAQSVPDAATTLEASSPFAYPLKLSSDGRYITDQNSQPVFLNADSAWSLIVQLNQANADVYLANRQQKGYNTILVNLIDHQFATNAPANIFGHPPFLSPGDFNTPNNEYFAHADYVLTKAAELGIVVLLAPMYLGFDCGDQGWCREVQNSSLATMRAWGRFVGQRYRNFPNIIWLIGGDTDPSNYGVADKLREFVAGIRDYDTNHLMTAHNGPGQSASDVWPNESWLDLNNVYTYDHTYTKSLQEYNRSPFKPVFFLEGGYENSGSSTPLSLRTQAYNAVLSGAYLGHFFGNCPIWNFGVSSYFCTSTNWQGQLDSTGSITLAYVGKLFGSRQFYRLVPDQTHTVLTAGYQSGPNYAGTARTSDGSTVIAYIPTSRTVTINMTEIAGTSARGWWFDPRTGQAILIGDFPTTGSLNFTSPSSNDWVLVLDNAALNLAAPGN